MGSVSRCIVRGTRGGGVHPESERYHERSPRDVVASVLEYPATSFILDGEALFSAPPGRNSSRTR